MIRKNTPTGRVIYFLGSLNFALLLLATIAIAIATATILESRFDTKIAQTYIYKAPWFVFWLAFLCVNLCCVTLTRWPWKKKHLGFVITHYGIITLLIGAMIGSKFGFEGNVTLHTDKPPTNRITVGRSVIQVESPDDRKLYTLPFDAAAVRPSEQHPKSFGVPGTNWKIVADDYAPQLVRDSHLEKAEAGKPAVILKMTSAMAAQKLEIPLRLGDAANEEADLFGLAKIRMMEELPPHEVQTERETQMVFANFAPVIQSEGAGSGLPINLSKDGDELTIGPQSYPRAELDGKELTVGGAKIRLAAYWPDFVMKEGKPSTQSDQPNNPAVLVRLEFPTAPKLRELALEVAPTNDGLDYQLVRDGQIYSHGTARAGEEFAAGWMDWSVRLDEFQPAAEIITSARKPEPNEAETGIQGFLAHLETDAGLKGEARWIESGRFTTLTAGAASTRIGYGLEVIEVPFTLRLSSFEVPRYEGTETPANYISTVEFNDPKTGKSKTEIAQMNQPASWPGGAWAVTSGFNYKFSQAEWNPQDLGETTLQVLYDPGWMLKWIGSIAICAGIALMFYWKPKKG